MPDLSTITPVTREEEFLDRIARAAASPNLPEVDASDNGDVLTVVSGEWAAAAPASELPAVSNTDEGKVLTVVDNDGTYEWAAAAASSGGNVLNVGVTVDGEGRWTMDKTYAEILAAFIAGTTVLVEMPTSAYYADPFGVVIATERDLESTPNVCYVILFYGTTRMEFASSGVNDYPEYSWN